MAGDGVVVSSSRRWNPNYQQLEVLESLFRGGMTSPSREEIQSLTEQLKKYGEIEEKNIFYWFQNHRARSQRGVEQPPQPSRSSEAEPSFQAEGLLQPSFLLQRNEGLVEGNGVGGKTELEFLPLRAEGLGNKKPGEEDDVSRVNSGSEKKNDDSEEGSSMRGKRELDLFPLHAEGLGVKRPREEDLSTV